MKMSLYSGGAAAVLASLITTAAFAQADATNFNRRAEGGANVWAASGGATPPATPPTVAAWMAQTAGKTFEVGMPIGSVRLEFAADGNHVTVRRMQGTTQRHSATIAHWSGFTGHNWAGNHGQAPFNYTVRLTPAGVEIQGLQAVESCGSHDTGCVTVYSVLYGLVPTDYLLNRAGGSIGVGEVFRSVVMPYST
jgi:hypothetical protein